MVWLGRSDFRYIAKFSTLGGTTRFHLSSADVGILGGMKCQFKHSDSCERTLTPEEGGLLLTMNQVRIDFSSETTI
jgi:hypothetical protein